MIIWTLFATSIAGIVGLIVFIVCLKNGQFEDAEDTKFQMFRDEE
jgi:cbb3-type cytochrome oxidase maturation protein